MEFGNHFPRFDAAPKRTTSNGAKRNFQRKRQRHLLKLRAGLVSSAFSGAIAGSLATASSTMGFPADSECSTSNQSSFLLLPPYIPSVCAVGNFCDGRFLAPSDSVGGDSGLATWECAHVVSGHSDERARAHVVSGRVCSNQGGDSDIATTDDDQFGSQLFAATTSSNYWESQLGSLVFPRSTSVTSDSNIATTDYCSDQFGSQVCEVSAWIEINANTSFGWFVNGFLEEVEDYIHTETVLNSFTTFAIGRLQHALSTCFRAWQQHVFWQLMEQYSEAAQPREWCSLESSVSSSEANACLRAFRLRHFTPYTCDPQADEAAAAAAAAAKAALWSRFRARGPLGSTRKRT